MNRPTNDSDRDRLKDDKNRLGENDANRDPITDEPGAHPVGTGIGAAAGGVAAGAATGAIVGTMAGPVGTAIGAGIGAVAGAVGGGLAGKAVAENINPTVEHTYWRDNYTSRPYVRPGASYDDYSPAYQYGWESASQYRDRRYTEVESDLRSGWDRAKGKSGLAWDDARNAVRDSWERVRDNDTARASSSSSTDSTRRGDVCR